jgi:hypothetical protein
MRGLMRPHRRKEIKMAFNPITEHEVQVVMRKHAIASTEKWMDEQIKVFERAAADLREYRDRFHEVAAGNEDSRSSLVDHLSWFVNSAAKGVHGNLRLDLAVNRAAELQRSEPKE